MREREREGAKTGEKRLAPYGPFLLSSESRTPHQPPQPKTLNQWRRHLNSSLSLSVPKTPAPFTRPMARHLKPPSPSPPPRPPPSDSDPGVGFDPVEEWLVDFDPAMSGELGSPAKGLGPAEEAVVPRAPEPTKVACDDSAGKVSDGSAAPNSCEFGVKAEPVQVDGSLRQAGDFCGGEIGQKAEAVSGRLDELLAPDQLLTSGIGDLAVKEDLSEGAVAIEMAAAPADVEMNTALSGCKEEQESSAQESESSEEEEESSQASSSSEDEEEGDKKDEESSEASSSSDEEELEATKLGGGGGANSLEALLEEGELMVGSEEEDEEPKRHSKSKHEAEVLGCSIL